MKLLEKILVGVDFTKSFETTLAMAIKLAKLFSSEIILTHVLPVMETKFDALADSLNKACDKRLNEMKEHTLAQGINSVQIILEPGIDFHKMNEIAEKNNVNLIVLGSGENEKYSKLGTTSKKVIQYSTIPVWTVKKDSQTEIKSILCPVDLSEVSHRALNNAIHLARNLKAKLTILHVLNSFSDDYRGLGVELKKEVAKLGLLPSSEFDEFIDPFDFHQVEWEKVIRVDSPSKEILKLVSEVNADLLIMGTTGKTGLQRMLMGSVAEKVIGEVPCSFITFKSEDLIKLILENEIDDIETHFKNGKSLLANGLVDDAVNAFNRCLKINHLHAPSWEGLATAYQRLGDDDKAKSCRNTSRDIQRRLWDVKIEAEIRSRNPMF